METENTQILNCNLYEFVLHHRVFLGITISSLSSYIDF